MLGTVIYSLVLVLDSNVQTVTTYQTLEPCQREVVRLREDLEGTRVRAVCVPTNQITMTEVQEQMRNLMNIVKSFDMKKDGE